VKPDFLIDCNVREARGALQGAASRRATRHAPADMRLSGADQPQHAL
jgi:hypothetical protein